MIKLKAERPEERQNAVSKFLLISETVFNCLLFTDFSERKGEDGNMVWSKRFLQSHWRRFGMHSQRRRTKSNSWHVSICKINCLGRKAFLISDLSIRHKEFLVIIFYFGKTIYVSCQIGRTKEVERGEKRVS